MTHESWFLPEASVCCLDSASREETLSSSEVNRWVLKSFKWAEAASEHGDATIEFGRDFLKSGRGELATEECGVFEFEIGVGGLIISGADRPFDNTGWPVIPAAGTLFRIPRFSFPFSESLDKNLE